MTDKACVHERIITWREADTDKPVGLWSCAACDRKFAPLEVSPGAPMHAGEGVARNLIERLRTPRITHHQVSHDWEDYETVERVHPVESVKLEAADMIERLLSPPLATAAGGEPND